MMIDLNETELRIIQRVLLKYENAIYNDNHNQMKLIPIQDLEARISSILELSDDD